MVYTATVASCNNMEDCYESNMAEPVCYFNTSEVQNILADSGDVGLVLMISYVAIASQLNPNMEDDHIANLLGKSPATVRDVRLKLTKAGWFKRIKITVKGEPHIMYLVGKEAVQNNHSFATLSKDRIKNK